MRTWSAAALALGALATAGASTTGQEICNDIICITALRDSVANTDNYTLTPRELTPRDKLGWLAIGFGSYMPNTPLVIVWPNADGSVTLSQRQASDHVMPTRVDAPPRIATLDSAASFANSSTSSFSFSVPTADAGANETTIIWAVSETNPASSDPGAMLIKHTWSGPTSVHMLAPWPGPRVMQGGRGVWTKTTKMNGRPTFALIAHVTCGLLATLLVLPGGVVVPRITRGLTTTRWWFRFHAVNQGLFAVALIAVAFGLAMSFGGKIDSNHRKCGVALFSLALLQTLLGLVAHFYRPGHRVRPYTFETKRGRGPSNFIHVAVGIVIVCVGWATSWYGFTSEWTYRGHGPTPYGLRYGWGVIVALWLGLYVFGIIFFLPRQLRIESADRQAMLREESKHFRSSAVALAHGFHMEPPRVHANLTPTPPPPALSPPPRTPRRGGRTKAEEDEYEYSSKHGHDSITSPIPHGSPTSTMSGFPRSPDPSADGHYAPPPAKGSIYDQFMNKSSASAISSPAPPVPSRPEGLDGNPFDDTPNAVHTMPLSIKKGGGKRW
ncbi:hypothetical protein Q8F55_000702 [Vanrija albida]|uniref:DOMON domain-containing protein n=1 Tax=Vanrija albida TaxID=181172 RepID=A0ABR3QEX8_9TREE